MTNAPSAATGLETALAARAQSLPPMRALAFETFQRLGFPHRRVEGWRWTDVRAALQDIAPAPAPLHEIAPPLAGDLAGLKPVELRIVNGRIDAPANAFPKGVQYGIVDAVGTIPELESHPLAALNVAMSKKALGVEIGAGVDFAQPIVIRHINTGAGFSFAQSLMRLCEGARATIIETFEGEGAGFYSHLFHLVLKEGASLHRHVIHETGAGAVTQSICAAKVEGAAAFIQASLSLGARLARHETHVHYVAGGAKADIASAALLAGDRHSDFTSEVLHIGEACTTRQRHKGVVKDKGRNVFQGKFRVMKSAQKTDARMNADALLLSETAETDHKPELEIYADDVQCAHGSTAGALDAEAIFYMRQRGLTDEAARALLIEAFVGGVFDQIAHPGIAQAFHTRIVRWLEDA
jgi:Fe-S cluster assembly protein SufD